MIKFYFELSPSSRNLKVWAHEESANAVFNIQRNEDADSLEYFDRVEIQDGLMLDESKLKPFLFLPYQMQDDFIKAVLLYANDKGISTQSESELKGKLSATEKHLDDLRSYFDRALNKIIQ